MLNNNFSFNRSRGIIWVCDVENSSNFLNNNETADFIEEYLPRLHWIARKIAESTGGKFIKWTGDGFLVWFECKLHRERGTAAKKAFEAAWYLSILSNVTKLGLDKNVTIKIRHGITFEEDALVTMINEKNNHSIDLLGRAVVLAFRLSGIPVQFPGIVTQRDLVTESKKYNSFVQNFEKLIFTPDELNKYFKGEKWSTKSIFATSMITKRKTGTRSILKNVKTVVNKADGLIELSEEDKGRSDYLKGLNDGPEWVTLMMNSFEKFLRDDLYKQLKDIVPLFEKQILKNK